MSHRRPATNQASHTHTHTHTHSPPLHFKQDPVCINKAPAFYQHICCLKVYQGPGVDTQRSPAQITPWGVTCQAAHQGPPPLGRWGQSREGGSRAFPASGALSPIPWETPAYPWSLPSRHCRWRHTIPGRQYRKEVPFKVCPTWRPLWKHLCCGRKNFGLRYIPSIPVLPWTSGVTLGVCLTRLYLGPLTHEMGVWITPQGYED